jgi:hypothetical protein
VSPAVCSWNPVALKDVNTFNANAMQRPPVEPDEGEFVLLCQQFQGKYSLFSNLLRINQAMTVVGSVHAQLDDIHELFDVCGVAPFTLYVSLGDFTKVCLLFSLALSTRTTSTSCGARISPAGRRAWEASWRPSTPSRSPRFDKSLVGHCPLALDKRR